MSFSKKDAKEALLSGAKNISDSDIGGILDKQSTIESTFKKNNALQGFVDDVKVMNSLLGDYFAGRYKQVPWMTIAAITSTLIYVINPVDIIPDVIPLVGFIDDAMVVSVCLAMINMDIEKYKEWKSSRTIRFIPRLR